MKLNKYIAKTGSLLGLTVLVATGCVTSHYNPRDNYTINNKQHQKLSSMASPVVTNVNDLAPITLNNIRFDNKDISDYDAKIIADKYWDLAPTTATLYMGKGAKVTRNEFSSARPGWINAYAKTVKDLESIIPENTSNMRFRMGRSSGDYVSPHSQDFEFSKDSGLLGIDLFGDTSIGDNSTFSIKAYEKSRGIKRDDKKYVIEITLGTKGKEEFELMKRRDMLHDIKDFVIEAGTAAAVEGPAGVAFMGSLNGIEYGFAFFETMNRTPSGTSLNRLEFVTDKKPKEVDMHSIISESKFLGANTIIAQRYGRNSLGIVYFDRPQYLRFDSDDRITIEIDKKGVGGLKSLLYHIARGLTIIPAREVDEETVTRTLSGENVNGGTIGGPGGSHGVSGQTIGGPGGAH